MIFQANLQLISQYKQTSEKANMIFNEIGVIFAITKLANKKTT